MSPVTLAELDPQTRAKVLEQISGAESDTTALATIPPAQSETVSLSSLDSQTIVNHIVDTMSGALTTTLRELEPYIQEIWRRLDAGEVIKVGQDEYRTRKEFCSGVLGRTYRAVHYMLKGGNQNRTPVNCLRKAPEPKPSVPPGLPPEPVRVEPADAIADQIELIQRILALNLEKRNWDESIELKNVIRDRRHANQMTAALGRQETHFAGKQILGSFDAPYIQRWTREEARTVLYERMAQGGEDLLRKDLARLKGTTQQPIPDAEFVDAPHLAPTYPSPLDRAFESLSPFYGEGARCPLNALPAALDWVKQNQPLSDEQVETLSAVINVLGQISTFTSKYRVELEALLKDEEVAT